MHVTARTFARAILLAGTIPLASAALIGSAAAGPVTLDVTVTKESDGSLVNGLPAFTTNNSFTPVQFQLTLTPDPTVVNATVPATNNTITTARTDFGPTSFSLTPFTTNLLALNAQGPTTARSLTDANAVFNSANGSSAQESQFVNSLSAGKIVNGSGSPFNYSLEITAVLLNTLHAPSDVVTQTAQALVDVLSNSASAVDFVEFSDTLTEANGIDTAFAGSEFSGTATLAATAPAAVPEPSGIALFGAALFGLGWLSRRKSI